MKTANPRKLGLLVFFSLWIQLLGAQTIIGGGERDPSAVLELKSENMGLLLPRLTIQERNAIQNPATGLLLYNLTLDCMEVNIGTPASPIWVCLTEASFVPSVAALGCADATHSGTLTAGTAASGVRSSVP